MKQRILSHAEITGQCRGLALLLHAGVSLGDGLFLLAREHEALRPVLEEMGRKLDGGSTLSDAMAESGRLPVYVSEMVRVGERSGRTEQALNALAEYYQERERTEHQVRSALTYPAVILLLILVVVAVLLVRVLPVFDEVYASLGSHLTGVAGGLLAVGRVLDTIMPALLILAALLALLILLFACCAPVRSRLLGLWNARRGDRGLARQYNNARFARALAMGLSSGLPLEESVELASGLFADVPQAAARCAACSEQLAQGQDLGKALADSDLMPPSACRMLTLALRGGSADRAMEDIAARMAEDAARTLDKKVSQVEPAMVLVASLLVGVILLSVMLPLMHIMAAIG